MNEINKTKSKNDHSSKTKPRRRVFFGVFVVVAVIGAIGLIEATRQFDLFSATGGGATKTETPIPPSAAFPRVLRDANNNELLVKQRPQRIASQTLGTDEILMEITDPKRVVALSKFALNPKFSNVVEAAQKSGANPVQNVEDILELDADLIFVASYSRAETVEQLQTAGAPVFRFANFDRIEDVKMNIRTVGYSVGEESRAEKLVERMTAELADSRRKIPKEVKPPRIMSYGNAGYVAGANTLFDDIIRQAGGVNVTAEQGISGFGKINAEQLLEWQPDFIVVGANRGEFEMVRRQLLANPAVAATEAARNDRIIMMDNRYFLTVSQFTARAVEQLVNEIYKPEGVAG